MAEGDKITTTSSMQPRSATQESAQQVRTREAREDAAHRTSEPPHVDIAAVVSTIDDMLIAIGKETLQLANSEELVAFHNHISLARLDLQRLADMERERAALAADVTDNG